MSNLKGQAAMEYLMTYGWAILAIVLVIAALIFLNPFRAPEICLFEQAGFTCNEPPPQLYVDGNGNLKMNVKVWNQAGQNIVVKEIMCTNAPGNEVPPHGRVTPASVQVQDQLNAGASITLVGVPCVDSRGDPIVSQPNQEFRGKMVVWYNYANDIDQTVRHQIKANVISRIAQVS
ncbi:MAG TPA: hypothetical protein PKJ97_01410 [Candidatus Bilamarchaeaceae archaeon]|nr:hypothetical protein [Candidatus Bilamarchaeaceae archaeon]